MKTENRILARIVARELSKEELEGVDGGRGRATQHKSADGNCSSHNTTTWKRPWSDGDTLGGVDD